MGLPAIFFRYELSPVKLSYTIFYEKWIQFFVKICAIVGGMFTVAGIFESFFANSVGKLVHNGDTKAS